MGDEQLKAGSLAGKKTCWIKSSNTLNWLERNDCSIDVVAQIRE